MRAGGARGTQTPNAAFACRQSARAAAFSDAPGEEQAGSSATGAVVQALTRPGLDRLAAPHGAHGFAGGLQLSSRQGTGIRRTGLPPGRRSSGQSGACQRCHDGQAGRPRPEHGGPPVTLACPPRPDWRLGKPARSPRPPRPRAGRRRRRRGLQAERRADRRPVPATDPDGRGGPPAGKKVDHGPFCPDSLHQKTRPTARP